MYMQWNISHKKNEILPFSAVRMDLEVITLAFIEINQINDKYCMISLKYGT